MPTIAHIKPHLTFRLLLTSIISTFAGGIHFGYQLSVLNPISEILKDFLEENLRRKYNVILSLEQLDTIWSFLVGSIFLGALAGSSFATWFLTRIGARKTLLVAAVALLISTPLFGLAYPFAAPELLLISRLLSGFAIGLGCTAQSIFLVQNSPVEFRGVTNSISGVASNSAFFLGSFLGLPGFLGRPDLWPFIFYVEIGPCLVHLLVNLVYFEEKPEKCHVAKNSEAELGLLAILKCRVGFRALSLAGALNFAVAFSGITALSFFGATLLRQVGFDDVDSKLINCLSVIPTIISSLIATLIIDRISRRTLLISSLLILAILNTLLMLIIIFSDVFYTALAWIFVAIFILFIFIFSIAIAPISFFLGAELAPTQMTSQIQSISIGIQYLGSFLSPIFYMKLHFLMGPSAFLIFIVPLLVTAVYFYFYLPESRGKTSQQISELLSK